MPKYATTVVRALLQLEDARTRQLNSIEAGVEDLLAGPYFTGRAYLEESLHGSTDERRRASARDARHAFIEAHSNYHSQPLKASYASAHVAVIDFMLGHADASRWAERAVSEASRVLSTERAKMGYIQVGKLRTSAESVSDSVGGLYFIGAGLVAMMLTVGSLKAIGLPIGLDTVVGIIAFFVAPFAVLERFKSVDKGLAKLSGDEKQQQQLQFAHELEAWVESLDTLAARTGQPQTR